MTHGPPHYDDGDRGGDDDSDPTDGDGDEVGPGFGGGEEGEGGPKLPSFSDFAPAPIVSFAKRPRSFILGAVLTTLLEVVTGIVTTLIAAINLVLTGDAGTGDQSRIIGIADIPGLIADSLIAAGSATGDAVLNAIEAVNAPLLNAAAGAGPLAPVAVFGVIAIETVVVVVVITDVLPPILQRILAVILDVLPGGGGLLP